MNKRLLSVFISFSIILSVCFVFHLSTTVKAEDQPDSIIVWIHSDVHYGGNGGTGCWEGVLDDVKNWDWNFSLGLGDISTDGGMFDNYRDIVNSKFSGTSHVREDIYNTLGNADELGGINDWLTYIDPSGSNEATSSVDNALRPYPTYNWTANKGNYVIKMGNVIWLMWQEEFEIDYTWLVDTIGYWSNHTTDYNIIFCEHYPFKPHAGWTQAWCTGPQVTAFLRNSASWNNVRLWLHGHRHWVDEDRNYTDVEANLQCYVISAVDNQHAGYESHSYFFTFTVDSTTIQIGDYNHGPNSWDVSGSPGNTSFELTYPFTWNTSSGSGSGNTSFVSVEGGGNGTFFRMGTPTFKWDLEADATAYHLQISTDDNFSNLVANLSDINEYNYPSHYSANATQATFVLPPEYRISIPDAYYIRIIPCK